MLLLDEPTAGMNPQESAALTEFMHQLRDERGITILLIEHDMKVDHERLRARDGARPRREDRRGPARTRCGPIRGSSRRISARRPLEEGNASHELPQGRRHQDLLRQHPGAQGHLVDRGRGRVRDADRLQRGREVHDAALDLGAHARPARARSSSTGEEISHLPPQEIVGHGHRPVARGPQVLPAHDGPREPRARRVPAPGLAGDREGPQRGSSSCSRAWTSARRRRRARCPAASSRCSPSGAR